MYVVIAVIVAIALIVYFLSRNKNVDQAVIDAANAEKNKVTGAVNAEVNQVKETVNADVNSVKSTVASDVAKAEGDVKKTVTDTVNKI